MTIDWDARLVGGSVLFGIGWGLAGFCPGPAIVALGRCSLWSRLPRSTSGFVL